MLQRALKKHSAQWLKQLIQIKRTHKEPDIAFMQPASHRFPLKADFFSSFWHTLTDVFFTLLFSHLLLHICISVHLWFFCVCVWPTHDKRSTLDTHPPPLPHPHNSHLRLHFPTPDHSQSSYRVSADGSFLVTLASGMELSLSTEPLLPGGVGGGVSPTASRCNISLPGDHAPSLIEWRQRKEQSKTNYSTYERRLRVKH